MAVLPPDLCAKLEHASDRIDSLKDEFGIQAVLSLLDPQIEADALALAHPSDKFTRALYLFLAQEFPTVGLLPDQRFNQAESQQSINQQWGSLEYASHFLGPKEATPRPNDEMFEQLRLNIAGLFGGVDPQDILLHHFKHVDRSHASRHESEPEQNKFHKLQHTITATFNGTMAFYKQVSNKEVVEMEEPAAIEVVFSWEPEAYVIQLYREQQKCAPACWNAEGFHCECSCMGENHGGGHSGGSWYEVSETFAVSWGVQRYSCRHLRVKKPGGRS